MISYYPHCVCKYTHVHVLHFMDVSWSVSQVYTFLDKMSFYTEAYKHKPNDVISREDGTLWRRQTHKLLYPLGQCLAQEVICNVSVSDFSTCLHLYIKT